MYLFLPRLVLAVAAAPGVSDKVLKSYSVFCHDQDYQPIANLGKQPAT